VLSLAGVMGGQESEVQDPNPSTGYPGTTTVLLEAAAWDFITIRKTMSATRLHSEAAARFSRGVHPAMAMQGLIRGIQLMCAISGATLAPGIVDMYPNPPEAVMVEFPVTEVERLLGFSLAKSEVVNLLRRLQFEVTSDPDGTTLLVTVPEHRLDIGAGVVGQADLAEEIARIYGYNLIPDSLMDDALPPQRANTILEWEENIRDLLAKAGLREVINYRFTTPEHEALLTPAGQMSSWTKREYVRISNPISAERTVMRQTLLVGLMDNVVSHMHHQPRQQLFEIGQVFYALPDDLPEEPRRLGILLIGSAQSPVWVENRNDSAEARAENMDFYDLKGVIESLLIGLHISQRMIACVPTTHNSFHPGRVASLIIGGETIGIFGQIHPLVCEAFGLGLDLQRPVLAAELDLDRLLQHIPADFAVRALPLQPPAYRDLAVVVDESRLSAEIEALIWESGGDLLREVRLFDVYRGPSIAVGKKSLAYALAFQSDVETLNDKAVNRIQREIINRLEANGAKLRA
jgi:phenylalanyl-tRNA synthetase beta chain